jgi:hypothetical protein
MAISSMVLDQLQRHVVPACVLTAFVISIAYVRSPRAKALIYSLPVPFSCAYLATGLAINATHITGLMLVVGYNWLVYTLVRAKMPLVAAIVAGAGAYFGGAMLLRPLSQTGSAALWWAAAIGLAGWFSGVFLYRPREEPGHRSLTAWWVKAPLIFAIAMGVYNATDLLAGGVGMFPYAGVFTSYESRHSLRTLAGQFTINSLGLLMCLVTIHLAEQAGVPVLAALMMGWVPVLAWIAFVRWNRWGMVREDSERKDRGD